MQGVCFRDWTVETATALGLAGWVRNLNDGRVEVLAQGAPATIDRLAASLHHGPSAARVDRVMREPAPLEDLRGFVRRAGR